MNKKYDPVIDFASFQKWRDDFNRGIQDVVDADSREQLGKNVGAVLTRSLDAIFEHAGAGRTANPWSGEASSAASASASASNRSNVSSVETGEDSTSTGSSGDVWQPIACLLYTSPSPRDATLSRMPSSA